VGDTPQITPGSLESASLTTWTTILDDTENLSKERIMLADSFNAQVADPLRNLAVRYDEIRKKVIMLSFHINHSTLILRTSSKRTEIKSMMTWLKPRKPTTHNVRPWNPNDPSPKELTTWINPALNPPTINIFMKPITPRLVYLSISGLIARTPISSKFPFQIDKKQSSSIKIFRFSLIHYKISLSYELIN